MAKTKQATHYQAADSDALSIRAGELGGYLVSTGNEPYRCGQTAAFSTADECADWVRGFLKNVAARKFGPSAKPTTEHS